MIEFFAHKSNLTPEHEMVKKDKRYFLLSEIMNEAESQRIIHHLLDNPKSREIVMKMRNNGITDVGKIVLQFKRCNWDILDRVPDITDSGSLNFEYVDCGFKGANKRCPFSTSLDTKPYCIIKNKFQVPYGKPCSANRKHNPQ